MSRDRDLRAAPPELLAENEEKVRRMGRAWADQGWAEFWPRVLEAPLPEGYTEEHFRHCLQTRAGRASSFAVPLGRVALRCGTTLIEQVLEVEAADGYSPNATERAWLGTLGAIAMRACEERLLEQLQDEVAASPAPVDQEGVDRWNRAFALGARVRYWTGVREGPGRESVTCAPAQLLCGTTSVVWIQGVRGCVALSHVEVIRG